MKKYYNYQIKRAVIVKQLVTIEYLELSSNFSYPNETHTFYEFAYIDSGSLLCTVDNRTTKLQQGDIYLIPPHLNHHYQAITNISSSVLIICFQCDSSVLEIANGKNSTNKDIRSCIANLLQESQKAFRFPFHEKLQPTENPPFGALQLIEHRTEEILIKLIRIKLKQNADIKLVMNSIELEDHLTNDIIAILKQNISHTITLGEICNIVHYSKTYANNIFKRNTGQPIMQYYIRLKIEEAKKYLRENLPTSIVSDRLSFDSPNYFAKVFKAHTGMTPTQYRKKVL